MPNLVGASKKEIWSLTIREYVMVRLCNCVVLIASISLAMTVPAHGAIEHILPGVNRLEDTDFEAKVDITYDDGDPVSFGFDDPYLLDGDILFGTFLIQHLYHTNNVTPSHAYLGDDSVIAGLFAAKVKSHSFNSADTVDYVFEPLTDAEFDLLFSGLGVSREDSASMLLVYDVPKSIGSFPDLSSTIAGSIVNATSGTKVAEFGILDSSDSWTARATDEDTVDPTNVTTVDEGSRFRASLGLTYDNPGDALEFLLVTNAAFPNGSGQTLLSPNEIHLNGTIVGQTTTEWSLVTHTDAWINAQVVPEPASMFAWMGLGLVSLLYARRRSIIK